MSPPCPMCGGAATLRYTVGDLNRRLSTELFRYYRCGRCGSVFVFPVPEDLGRFYPPEYYALPPTRDVLAAGAEGERYKVKLVQQYATAGRLLEIGPGAGGFAYLARQAGFDVDALEMDAGSAHYLRTIVGVRAIHANATPDVLATLGNYDVIALWHVIEHVPAPLDLLDALAASLAPSGVLIIAAPNPVSFQFRVFGSRWTHLDAPRHLHLIHPTVLVARAQARGLRLRLATTNDRGGLDWNVFGWRESLCHAAPFRIPARILNPLARTLAALAAPLERRPMRGSAYTLAFTAPGGP